jgi:carbon storage regulator CsrA
MMAYREFALRYGERIRIGKSIAVSLARNLRNKARIGVEAPKEIPVHRREIAESIRRREAE